MDSTQNEKGNNLTAHLIGETFTVEVQDNVFLLALREQVVFPSIRVSIRVGRLTFAQLSAHCKRHQTRDIAAITMKPGKSGTDAVYEIGTLCKLIGHSKSGKEDDTVAIIVEGRSRFKIASVDHCQPYTTATVNLIDKKEEGDIDFFRDSLEERDGDGDEVQALVRCVQQSLLHHLKENFFRIHQKQNVASLSALLGGKQTINAGLWPRSASLVADMVGASLVELTLPERQQMLACVPVQQRLELVRDVLRQVSIEKQISRKINSNIRMRAEEEARELVLQRQMQELQKEMRKVKKSKKNSVSDDSAAAASPDKGNCLDEQEEDDEGGIAALKRSLSQAGLSAEALKIAKRETRRLQSIQPHHPEYIVCQTYLETLAGLPWNKSSECEQNLDLNDARDILDADHYGLEVVKRRILEFLAVHKMRGDMKGPILCLHGPPGVGKTSLGKSIAKALGRQFHRIALGGVRDEAELRGHRRTYIGSMPGAIIQSLTASEVNNPVVLLDEVDKLTKNKTFNPSGALLEILDPEQNHAFKDNYINCPFDLSKILFICTCNEINTIDRPLLDRMEVIDLSGYTVAEKVAIAEKHLIPKQLEVHGLHRKVSQGIFNIEPAWQPVDAEHGEQDAPRELPPPSNVLNLLNKGQLKEPLLVLNDAAITELVSKWTSEGGVRSLERKIAQVCRWAALRTALGPGACVVDETNREKEEEKERALATCGPDETGVMTVDSRHLPHIVGVEIFEPNLAERLSVGVAMGLGVTGTGGQLLFVEAARYKGSGRLTLTGQLGEVMQESVMAAMTLLKGKIPNPPKTHAALAPLPPSSMEYPPAAMASSLGSLNTSSGTYDDPSEHMTKQLRTLFPGPDEKPVFDSDDVHVHFPAGAIQKDGPSAGVTATLALASLLFGRPVRSDTAVTGEITLRGHILPVGGIKDKVLAAHRAGIRHVLLPHANMRHAVNDLPSSVAKEIELHYVKHIDEALYWMFSDNSDSNVEPLLSKL